MLSQPDERQPSDIPAGAGDPYPYRPGDVRDVVLTPTEVIAALRAAKEYKHQQQKEARYRWTINNPQAKRPVSAFGLARMKLREAQRTIPGFVADKWFRGPFVTLCLYFAGDVRFEMLNPSYSLDKGLGFFGPTGPGKTTLLELFQQNPRAGYEMVAATELVAACIDKTTGGEAALGRFCNRPIFIDDVGEEAAEAFRQYAKKDELPLTPFASFVSRVERAQRRGDVPRGSFHFTTNLPVRYREGNTLGITPDSPTLESRYDRRATSRLFDLVNFISFPGDAPDRRETKRNSNYVDQPVSTNAKPV
jgi:ribosomal protein S14